MALKLFTDRQKKTLATEAGYRGPYDPDMFARDENAQTGEATMYMKLGNMGKFYGASPMKATMTRNPIGAQAEAMQSQFGGKPQSDAYNAYLAAIPSSKQTYYDNVGMSTGIYSELEAITQQQMKMMQSMTGNQAAIFSARNPDGTPVDPRVMVAQYRANMQSATDRVDQLRQLETVYKSQLKVLGDAEYDKAQKQAETAKTALLYLKDLEDQKNKDRDAQFRQQELAQRGSQFDRELAQKGSQFQKEQEFRYSSIGKPELVQDKTGEYQWATPPNASVMRTDRHSNPTAFTTDIAKQAGLVEGKDYSVGDAFGDNGQYNTAKLLGDPIATTIRVIDKIGFKTGTGATRWSYTDKLGLTDEKWKKMDTSQKTEAIKQMYEMEGGNGSVFSDRTGTVSKTGIMGQKKQKSELTYEDKLKFVSKELGTVPIVSLQDANDLTDALVKQYPTKKRDDVMDDIYNSAPENMRVAIDAVGVSKRLNSFDAKTVKSTLDQLSGQYESKESVFKVLHDAGFFDKYEDGIWDSEQLDAAQEWFDENGYDITDGKIKKK